LTLKMTLSVIIIIIFVINAPKYSNILIDNKIGGLSLSELHPNSYYAANDAILNISSYFFKANFQMAILTLVHIFNVRV